jgi:WD40 repeat protein
MRKKLFRYSILVFLSTLLAGCSDGQSEAVLTPGGDDDSVQDVQIAETPEETLVIESAPCDLPLPGPDDWEVVLCEQFDDNRNEWEVESQDNPYARYTSAIRDGEFVVDYTAKGFAGYQRTALTWFAVGEEKDFALSIKGLMDSSYQEASWGIAFRGDEDSFFMFSISNDGTYKFEIFENGRWVQLITPKNTNSILLGEENTLRIEAGGQDFYFSINDKMVNRFNGALLGGEEILLIVSAKEGVSAVFTFDDVVLQR